MPQHTVTLERHAGILAIVERFDGDLVKVCGDVRDTDVAVFADAARQWAAAYGAVYVPPGK